MAILTGRAIAQEVEAGGIEIDPFDDRQLNPASYDVRLGDKVCVYTSVVFPTPYDLGDTRCNVLTGMHFTPSQAQGYSLDSKERQPTLEYRIGEEGWVLRPNILYLMHTAERIHTTKFVPVLDGKSSIGRLGVQIHVTAGYGDPGFDGQYTLEVVCVHPVRLYAGMRIGQMRFHQTIGEPVDYRERGHYTGREAAMGAVPSYSYKQFEEDNG